MANLEVILKDNDNVLYPQAMLVGIDVSNVLASGITTYTSSQDCFAVLQFNGNTGNYLQIKINNVLVVSSRIIEGLSYDGNRRTFVLPIKKGQVITTDYGTFTIYGVKH